MKSLPHNVVEYARTKTFDETTVPTKLQADHTTKASSWGLIVIEQGVLDYTIDGTTYRLDADRRGVIPPEIPHRVSVVGKVSFHVAFFRVP